MMSSLYLYLFLERVRGLHFGAIKDGYNSAIRYYYNNFANGFHQVREREGEGAGGREREEGGRVRVSDSGSVIKMGNLLFNCMCCAVVYTCTC